MGRDEYPFYCSIFVDYKKQRRCMDEADSAFIMKLYGFKDFLAECHAIGAFQIVVVGE